MSRPNTCLTSSFAPDGTHLLVNRTNRQQNVLDVLAIDVNSGEVKTVVKEEQKTWQENAPSMTFLKDQTALHMGDGAKWLAPF